MHHCHPRQEMQFKNNQAPHLQYCMVSILLLFLEAVAEGMPFKLHFNTEHCTCRPIDCTLFISPSSGFKPRETRSKLQSSNSKEMQIHSQDHSSGRRWKNKRKRNKFLSPPDKSVTPQEEMALLEQLGYVPPNLSCVSARSNESTTCLPTLTAISQELPNDSTNAIDTSSTVIGRPIAIRSYPLLMQLKHNNVPNQQIDEESDEISQTSIHSIENHRHYLDSNSIITTPFPTLYWLTCPHVSKAISELERRGYVREFQSRLESDDSLARRWLNCHAEYAKERWNVLSPLHRNWLSLMPGDGEGSDGDNGISNAERRKIESMREMLQYSGVAGTDHRGLKQPREQRHSNDGFGQNVLFVPSVKCLHSHYAHYRSQTSKIFANNCHEEKDDAILHACEETMTLNVVGEWTHQLLMANFPYLIT